MYRTPVAEGRRKRPKGNSVNNSRHEEEFEIKKDYYETLKECEQRKADVLEKMLVLKQEQWDVEKKITLERWEIEKRRMLKELDN